MKYLRVAIICIIALAASCTVNHIKPEPHLVPIELNPYGSFPMEFTSVIFPTDDFQYKIYGDVGYYRRLQGREFLPSITFDPSYFITTAQRRLRELNYVVIGDESELFSGDSHRKVYYKLGGIVRSAALEVYRTGSVKADIVIEWQLFSLEKGETVAKITTRGYGISTKSGSQCVMNAYIVALDNLLANRDFTGILKRY